MIFANEDLDHDGTVDAIDNCPDTANAGQSDVDADGVGDACDVCVDGPNPEQGDAVLGQTIVAATAERFAWPVPADVMWVRGPLEAVSAYAVDVVETAAATARLSAPDDPPAGQGFYYLVRPSCAVGSWQTSLGAEPERDATLP